MSFKCENAKIKQSQIANQISLSTSTLQRYRNDINMPSPHRNTQNNTNRRTKKVSNTNFDNNSHHELDVKRPQRTSNDHKTNKKPNKKNKNILKAGSMQENVVINEHYLDENLDNNDI